MPQSDLPKALMPSLKDRLLDPESIGTKDHPGYSLQQVIESVRNDLEDLLNTRRPITLPEGRYAQLAESIVGYGLPDLTSVDASTPVGLEEIGRILEQIITLYEPRLRNVKATKVMTPGVELRVRFHIDAQLRVDPAPDVAFETVVELITGHASIQDRTG
jgi:type VI secretion system protein ImpF